jgi:LmbE family N-acetylglucosaminyl deacetylase
VTFKVEATVGSLKALVNRFYADGSIRGHETRSSLLSRLGEVEKSIRKHKDSQAIGQLKAFINEVKASTVTVNDHHHRERGHDHRTISAKASAILIADAQWVIASLR